VATNDVLFAGQEVGEISEAHFDKDFTDHTHYVITDVMYSALQRHPLSIYGGNDDKDPHQTKPRLKDHSTNGTMLFQQQGAAGIYLPFDATHPLHGDLDLIAEVADELGTLPDQVPTKLGYWIEAPANIPGCIDFHNVKSAAAPYVLFSWHDAYFGDAASPLAISQEIADVVQNLGPTIMVGTETYPWENYKHFILTNTKGTDGAAGNVDEAEYWNSNAKTDADAETSATANYKGKPDTSKAREARFPDGEYTLHILASDLIHANEDLTTALRTENFCPIVCSCTPTGTVFGPTIMGSVS
jgi:hypothetical protein